MNPNPKTLRVNFIDIISSINMRREKLKKDYFEDRNEFLFSIVKPGP